MIIFKFFSKACAPCRLMSLILSQVRGANIEDIDIEDDSNSELVYKYGIKSVPTIIILDDDSSVIKEFRGVTPLDKIQAVIDGR